MKGSMANRHRLHCIHTTVYTRCNDSLHSPWDTSRNSIYIRTRLCTRAHFVVLRSQSWAARPTVKRQCDIQPPRCHHSPTALATSEAAASACQPWPMRDARKSLSKGRATCSCSEACTAQRHTWHLSQQCHGVCSVCGPAQQQLAWTLRQSDDV